MVCRGVQYRHEAQGTTTRRDRVWQILPQAVSLQVWHVAEQGAMGFFTRAGEQALDFFFFFI